MSEFDELKRAAEACVDDPSYRIAQHDGNWYIRTNACMVFDIHRPRGFPQYIASHEAYARLAVAANPRAVRNLIEAHANEKESADHWRDLAKDRHNRILELSIESNKLKDEIEALRKDAARLAYLVEHQAIVECSKNGLRYWLVYPDGWTQSTVHDCRFKAIDAAMESENG